MQRFEIQGPVRLTGSVQAEGAKNAALPALAAALLADTPVRLSRIPDVRDIRTMLQLLEHLGIHSQVGENAVVLEPIDEGSPDDAPYELVKTMRASVLVLGPLVARRGHARVSLPGGCAIGVRPIDQHLAGLEALGARVELAHGYVTATADRLRGARFRFSVPTVTGTENLMMAAALATGETVLENCAREPEIEDLARLLVAMGAQVEGAGSPTIHIAGVDSLQGTEHAVIADRIEGGTYLIGAAITGGDVTLEQIEPADLASLLSHLEAAGCEVETGATHARVRRTGELIARDVTTAPHPGFPTDLQAQYMALMTQAHGAATIREQVFENRFQHVPELNRIGATIEVDGSTAVVHGPTPLAGATVMATDLRASACLVLAGLVAEGRTQVSRIYHLDRGYAHMEDKLNRLGAKVQRTEGTRP